MLAVVVNLCGDLVLRHEPLLYPLRRSGQMMVYDMPLLACTSGPLLGVEEMAGLLRELQELSGGRQWKLCLVVDLTDPTEAQVPRLKAFAARAEELAAARREGYLGLDLVLVDRIERDPDTGRPLGTEEDGWALDALGFIRSAIHRPDRVSEADLDAVQAQWDFKLDADFSRLGTITELDPLHREALEASIARVNEKVAALAGRPIAALEGIGAEFQAEFGRKVAGAQLAELALLSPSQMLKDIVARRVSLRALTTRQAVNVVRIAAAGDSPVHHALKLQYLLMLLAGARLDSREEGDYWSADVALDVTESAATWRRHRGALLGGRTELDREAAQLQAKLAGEFLDSGACTGRKAVPALEVEEAKLRCSVFRKPQEWEQWSGWWEAVRERARKNAATAAEYLASQAETARIERPPEVTREGTAAALVTGFKSELDGALHALAELTVTESEAEGWDTYGKRLEAGFIEQAAKRARQEGLWVLLAAGLIAIGCAYVAGLVQPPTPAQLAASWAVWASGAGAVGALLLAGLFWGAWRAAAGLRDLAKDANDQARALFERQRSDLLRANEALLPRCRANVARRNLIRALKLQERQRARALGIQYHKACIDDHLERCDRVLLSIDRGASAAQAGAPDLTHVGIELPSPCEDNRLYAPQTCSDAIVAGPFSARVEGADIAVTDTKLFLGASRVHLALRDVSRFGSAQSEHEP